MLEIRAKTMQYMQSLPHACHAVQVLPTLVVTATNTAHSPCILSDFECLVGFIDHFKVPEAPPRASIMRFMGLFGPPFFPS